MLPNIALLSNLNDTKVAPGLTYIEQESYPTTKKTTRNIIFENESGSNTVLSVVSSDSVIYGGQKR